MNLIIFLFLSTALLGVYLFIPVIKKKKAPRIAILAHGTFAVVSVAFLTKSFLEDGTIHEATMVLFALAAINGLYMFFLSEIVKRPIPAAVLILHANLAAIAFISLIYQVWFV